MPPTVRRRWRAVTCGVALGLAASTGFAGVAVAGTPAATPTPTPSSGSATTLPHGLFGSENPAGDGVRRQSLAIMALSTAGYRAGDDSIIWLRNQQCADGGFTPYRADTATPCRAGAEDTRATAYAMEGLSAARTNDPNDAFRMDRAAAWLRRTQNADGGFGLHPTSPSDSISTGRALSGLAAANQEGGYTAKGATGWTFLESRQIGCSKADAALRGGFSLGGGKPPAESNAASAWAVLGLLPEALPTQPLAADNRIPTMGCPPATLTSDSEMAHRAAANGAGYLGRTLDAHGGTIPGTGGRGVDFPTTVAATLAIASTAFARPVQTEVVNYLKAHQEEWIRGNGTTDQASSLAQLVLFAYGTGQNSHSFGGTDLIARLQQTEVGGVHSSHALVDAPKNPANRRLIGFLLLAAAVTAAAAVLERRRRLRTSGSAGPPSGSPDTPPSTPGPPPRTPTTPPTGPPTTSTWTASGP